GIISHSPHTPLLDLICLGIASQCTQAPNIVLSHEARVRVLRSQLLLTDHQCSLAQRLGLFIPALIPIEGRQVTETSGGVGMGWSQLLLLDSQCSLIQRFGLFILALALIEVRQVVEALGGIGMGWSQLLLADG